jgi:hypothetical protein
MPGMPPIGMADIPGDPLEPAAAGLLGALLGADSLDWAGCSSSSPEHPARPAATRAIARPARGRR